MDGIHYIHIIFFFLLKTQHFFPPTVTAAIQCLLMPSTTQVTTELDSNWEPQWHCCFVGGTGEVPKSFLGKEDHKGSVPLLLSRDYFGVWMQWTFAPSPDPLRLCQVFMCKLNICIAIQDRHFCTFRLNQGGKAGSWLWTWEQMKFSIDRGTGGPSESRVFLTDALGHALAAFSRPWG